ncbi:cilia- and flagella-associated protein 45-like [Acyrthosiphon pisum]|uniref:Cilia- and flagella-associated protein 45 n=1 Tax=Acyrthosiphon pisum TaxID=7029 RepID=A0A8R2AAF2_ACYPI|nr:cilia- and flagella-associated protein 45-like [Acyrthosiphon pisum]|eukprot:XP_003243991.1 PREDICTED: cilia- and flagella-associated protein 45-like [Acyrthosiphon pisum]
MSTKFSDNVLVEPIPSKKIEIQKYRTPCEAYKIDRKDDNEIKKSEESSKEQPRSDLDQYKLQQHICKLDKLGKSIQSLPGKRVLDKNTYGRLKNAAVVVTAEERRMANQQRIANEERLKAESEARKEYLQKFNMFKTKGPKLAQLDEEANKKTNYLLNRAYELRQEQEYEIKQCNSLILSTKCHAIRCAQIEEKELIQKEMKQEQRRSEEIMEQQRLLAAKKYEKAVEADRLKKKLQATEIVQQMKENEITREWEAARASEDARVRTEAAIEAQRAEVIDYRDKLIKQAEMRKEFLQINAQLKDLKSIEKELVKVEILQIQAYDKKKNEREMAYEEEMKKLKMSKEKEIAKIQANQKATQDFQAAKDELNALRTQDKVEREWRRKEHEEAVRKIKQNEDLKEARRQQIEGQRESYAFEIQREKEEFDKIIKLNVEDIEKTKESDRQTKMKLDEHRKNLLKQISEKELERIKERKDFFQEGITYQQAEAAREKALRNTMQKKIDGLRVHKLPTKYVQGIERQLKLRD